MWNADGIGSETCNRQPSERRADAVRDYLVDTPGEKAVTAQIRPPREPYRYKSGPSILGTLFIYALPFAKAI